jgi:hypothetical protein
MKIVATSLVAWLGMTALAAQPPPFPQAAVRLGCTQEDTPAIEIYLTTERFAGRGAPSAPFIRLEIAGREFGALTGKAIALSPLRREVFDPAVPLARAAYKTNAALSEWLRGTVTLQRAGAGRPVEGTYALSGRERRSWTGTFRAVWLPGGGTCG